MRKDDSPYSECGNCKTIDDCKHAEIALDDMGTALPPDNCPKPMVVMRRTLNRRKIDRFKKQS